ncbi:uncharacterized protein LOC118314505 isoform X1 [Scophthalmus maximus]|uniref:uncharacterized protein LOC118314505 isoform X1 n=1 Tax=Scophthalmus maximus TaxID=52904 RepID=UPI001FA8C99C|nr:uncharacterized protein LOC118314505 isoform X1 [Scophthalmus maximus]
MANNSSQKSNQLRRPSPEGSVYLPDAEGDRITSESQVSYKETRYPQECAEPDLWKKMEEMQDIRKLNSLFEAHRYQADVKAHIKGKKPIALQMREEKLKEKKGLIEYEPQKYRRLNDYKETRYPQQCADPDPWKKMEGMQDITKLNSLFEAHRYQADVKAHIKVEKPIALQLREEKLKEKKGLIEYEQQRYRRLNDYKETRYPQECADSDLWKKMGEMQDITKLNSLFEAHRYQADVKAHIKVKKRINLQLREEKLKETKWSNEYEQQRYRRLNDYKEKGLRSLSAGGLSDTDLSHAEKTTRLVVQKTSLRPSRFTQSHKNILRPTHLPPVSKAAKINITVSKSTGGGSGPTFRKSNSCSANTRHKESQLSACNRSAPPVYLPPRSSKLASNLNEADILSTFKNCGRSSGLVREPQVMTLKRSGENLTGWGNKAGSSVCAPQLAWAWLTYFLFPPLHRLTCCSS